MIYTKLKPRYMASFSALYTTAAVALYKFSPLGDTSLVYANIINLAARIAYCVYFANSYYSSFHCKHLLSWSKTLPGVPFLVATTTSGILLRRGQDFVELSASSVDSSPLLRKEFLISIVFGGLLAIGCAGLWWKTSEISLSV